MKLFLGISIPHSVQSYLADLQPEQSNSIRLVLPKLMHITLHYIGEAEPKQIIESVEHSLKSFEITTFKLHLTELGYFGAKSKPAVLWASPNLSESLKLLHSQLTGVLNELNMAIDDRHYQPHITLARGRWRKKPDQAERDLLQRFYVQTIEPIEFEVLDFVLFESKASECGREYRVVERFSLIKE
ncbi:RNA 2',3'-cyclic phosphodiesterase [Litoribacillus peritrichatus]|uniref:RNA 2',3'-cyclic phosphodiesterase n=1 Tax=Litoribacillus peritrichatus TaxID=718191 RepID=A0ABP7MT57_9GAMM